MTGRRLNSPTERFAAAKGSVFKSREITGEKAALEKPEEQIEEMTEEQHAGEVNGAGVLDRLINGVSVWP